MTEWNASGYEKISGLQEAMAREVLSLLELTGNERVLDLGCGNGKVTAEIASRVPGGSVVGVDASSEMTAFASRQFADRSNLRFETHDIRVLPFQDDFDLVVSFNALHWIPDQENALRSLRGAMKPDATAKLRLVPKGERKSLEDVVEETRLSSRWRQYFEDFHDPYLHLTAEQYAALAEKNGLRVRSIHTEDKAWDFKTRAAFEASCKVTLVEWTKRLPESERVSFVNDVLDRYRLEVAHNPPEDNVFKFYQMDVTLSRT